MSRTAIVLAGGRSSRFGTDKLAAELQGRAVLAATLEAVSSVIDGVIVAGPALPDGFEAGETPVALVGDAEPFGGPLAALANVLRWAAPDPAALAIVVGGDMPLVVPAVLATMLDRLAADASIDALLLEPPGVEAQAPRRQVLPLAIRVEPAAAAASTAVGEGRRSLQSLVDRLPHRALPIGEWLPLDRDGRTLTDVDTRADLDRLRPSRVR